MLSIIEAGWCINKETKEICKYDILEHDHHPNATTSSVVFLITSLDGFPVYLPPYNFQKLYNKLSEEESEFAELLYG